MLPQNSFMNSVKITKDTLILMKAFFLIFKVFLCDQEDDFFQFYPVSLNWHQARDFCKAEGGTLATFYGEEFFNKVCEPFLEQI